jgi:hypothetical protein
MIDLTTAQRLIHENMPVVCSNNGQFAVVDHLEGVAAIKLNKDDTGQHHYIPLAWVTVVDDKVHVDRPGEEVMKVWATSIEELPASEELEASDAPPADAQPTSAELGHNINSVDATMGQPLVELALSTIEGLLTGDLKNVPAVVASDMNLWLERHKHLAERAIDPQTGTPAVLPSEVDRQAQEAQAEPPNPPITDAVTGPWVGKRSETPTA